MATGIHFDLKGAKKKTALALQEIDQSIGGAHAEVINFAQHLIQTEGFIDGTSQTEKARGGSTLIYKAVPGGNRSRRKGKQENVFHKTKIVERQNNSLRGIFTKLSFKKHSGLGKNLYSAQNHGVKVEIRKSGNKYLTIYSLLGKFDKIFFNLQHGGKKIVLKKPGGEEKNVKLGQRQVIKSGLGKALRRWQALNKFYLSKGIKEANKKL